MALNSTGPLSFGGSTVGQSINLELGFSATAQADINSASFRGLAGVPSGQISVSNFYGKSSSTYYFAAVYNAGGDTGTVSIDSSDNYYFCFPGPAQYPAALRTNSVGTLSWQKSSLGNDYIQGGYVSSYGQVWAMSSGYKRAFDATTGNASGRIRNINTHNNYPGMPVGLATGTAAFTDNERFSGCCGVFNFYGVSYIYNGDLNLRKNVWRDCPGTQGQALSIVADASSNVYTSGYLQYNCGQQRGLIVKMASDLSVTWARVYGYTFGYARAIGINASGDLAVGYQRGNSELNLLKYNNSGTLQWANKLTGSTNTVPCGAAVDSSGNLYFVNRWRNASTNNDDTLIVKYNSAGTLQWQRLLSCVANGSTSNLSIQASYYNCLKIDSTGALVISLAYFTGPQGPKLFIAKLPNDGSKTGTYNMTDSNANTLVITYAAASATAATASGYVSGSETWPSTAVNTNTADFGANTVNTYTTGYTQLII